MDELVVVVATHPEEEAARSLAARLVEERLAACVQVLPGLHSTYRWAGAVETAQEVRLEIKTTASRLPELTRLYGELHPYEVPEFVVFPAPMAMPAYLSWVRESVSD
jgi:periplasmic divalent cation tolerance protein